MRIEHIDLYRVSMPLVYPFRTAFGNDAVIESVLVRMKSGGREGWGEASPWAAPAYSAEWAAGAFGVLRDWLAPRLIGKDIADGTALQHELSAVKGNYFAKASLDLAWWDLFAQEQNRPLYRALGGERGTVDVGADFGVMETIDLLLKTIEGAVAAGYKRVKLKFRPGWDLPMVRAVRKAFPTTVFHVDCNSAYRLEDAAILRQLDQYNLAMIEQPLMHDDLIDHATLQKQIHTPICLDESITSLDKARKAIAIGACQIINIKPGRVGGLTNALAIHNLAHQHNIPCWVGGMLESAVGAAHCLALATLPNIRYPSDIFPTSRFYAQDLSEPDIRHCGPSQIAAQEKPGIGVRPNPQQLQKLTMEQAKVVS